VPPRRWWTALFNEPGGRDVDVYVDVTTVARWPSGDCVEMIDLDLDVVRRADGTVYVDDEDEFEEHRRSLGYPPRLVDGARAAAARLVLEVEDRRPPFDDAALPWLAQVI
jgi:uncharacterized protein